MSEGDTSTLSDTVLGGVVRLVGIVILLVGLWAGIKVIVEAWSLYQDPSRIEAFAEAVNAGSNLDGLVAGIAEGVAGKERVTASNSLRLSYFAAWFIALLLLFVVGSLAMAAITTGGQLALYDLQFRRYSRHVLKEIRNVYQRG